MQNMLYRITFLNQNKVYELYAEKVGHGHLGGFIEVSRIVFGETTQLVVDPAEEKLKAEFADVKSFHVPFHAVIRIDEVTKHGTSKIRDSDGVSNITPFPVVPNNGN